EVTPAVEEATPEVAEVEAPATPAKDDAPVIEVAVETTPAETPVAEAVVAETAVAESK
ncbi:hypothetical protein CPC16_005189, partial [Podila verticillata]